MEENQIKHEEFHSAKEVSGRVIGRFGLFYITLIVVVGVVSSLYLENEKLAPVIGMLSIALTALISLLVSVAGATPKEERPEFKVISDLIDKLDREDQPMQVTVADGKVIVTKGADTTELKNGA